MENQISLKVKFVNAILVVVILLNYCNPTLYIRPQLSFAYGRVLLAVINLCIRIKMRLSIFDADYSVMPLGRRSIAVSVQQLPDAAVQSVSTAACVR